MTTMPIQKIIFASLAFAFNNWQKLLEASIFPFLIALPFITNFRELNVFYNQFFSMGQFQENFDYLMLLYPLMFTYGNMALLINIYRIVVQGNNSIVRFGVVLPNRRLGRFFLITILLAFAQLPGAFLPFLKPFIYFLLIPILLNLVSIANDVPYKKIKLSISVWGNIFLVNFGILYILLKLLELIDVNDFIYLSYDLLSTYWMAITLALCYRVIMANSSTQSP